MILQAAAVEWVHRKSICISTIQINKLYLSHIVYLFAFVARKMDTPQPLPLKMKTACISKLNDNKTKTWFLQGKKKQYGFFANLINL